MRIMLYLYTIWVFYFLISYVCFLQIFQFQFHSLLIQLCLCIFINGLFWVVEYFHLNWCFHYSFQTNSNHTLFVSISCSNFILLVCRNECRSYYGYFLSFLCALLCVSCSGICLMWLLLYSYWARGENDFNSIQLNVLFHVGRCIFVILFSIFPYKFYFLVYLACY